MPELLELSFPLEAPAEVHGDEWGSLGKRGSRLLASLRKRLNAGPSCHSNSALRRRGQPMAERPGEVMPWPGSLLV